MATYGYFVNLDERGEFYADVRSEDSKTLYEVRSDEDGEIWQIEFGFMADPHDVSGLFEMLVQNGVLSKDDELLPANEAEAMWEQAADNDEAEGEHDVLGHDAQLHRQASQQHSM
jgi:hypothetical protein